MGRHQKLLKVKTAEPVEETTLEQLFRECVAQARAFTKSIQETIDGGMATPAMVREAATLYRAVTGLSKEERDREKATRDRFAKLTEREREELAIELICSMRRAVREEAVKRLQGTIRKGGEA